MIKDAIRQVVEGQNLTEQEAMSAMTQIMNGEATSAQIACLITALRMKGETVDEIAGFVRVMREMSVKVKPSRTPLIDTCGTGGDRLNTFNVSTTAAFVVAGVGVAVAKHGNRAASSKCGSADVLEALGVRLSLSPDDVGRCIDECGIGFMFAPMMHPAMKHAVNPRKEIAVRTIFNILGPLTNPAGAEFQLIGVFSPHFCKPMAQVLSNLGTKRAMVVHGHDGMDEITIHGDTFSAEIDANQVKTRHISPKELGFSSSGIEEISGGATPEANAQILMSILSGEKSERRDIVLANAAAAIMVAGKSNSLKEGIEIAEESIDSGAALKALNKLRSFTEAYAK